MKNVIAVVGTILVLAISYAFGLAGEPRSEWLWCTVLGLCS